MLFLLVVQAAALLCMCCASAASNGEETRYLLYSVNAGEGFNLRRDVHMRAATLVHTMRGAGQNWVLVLPPWPILYHWKSPTDHYYTPWGSFFNLESLNEFVPSIEFHDYLEQNGHVINEVMILQGFPGEWSSDNWGKMEEQPCLEPSRFQRLANGDGWEGKVFGKTDLTLRTHRCVCATGMASMLRPHLQDTSSGLTSFLVERFENLLHDEFGGQDYWMARRSMVYAADLRSAGNTFMRERLGYDAGGGKGREKATGGGGNYIAVHMRRQDYIYSHRDTVPSIKEAAAQINTIKRESGIQRVFLATDAPLEDKNALSRKVKGLVWYTPTDSQQARFEDGGVAIIDQWIAAHAKYFIGSAHSTFSFRIREDRQFLGFTYESTFNDLCGPGSKCDKPTYWKLVDLPPNSGPSGEQKPSSPPGDADIDSVPPGDADIDSVPPGDADIDSRDEL